ncbi:hypothetical protein NC652_023269 [Populus alba x Populus x berolinensis]|nr:hypothetical protein NC652_023269 [Populus alba x Populus x berolinensis]
MAFDGLSSGIVAVAGIQCAIQIPKYERLQHCDRGFRQVPPQINGGTNSRIPFGFPNPVKAGMPCSKHYYYNNLSLNFKS